MYIRKNREKQTSGDKDVISAHVKEDVQRKRKSQRAKGHRMTTCIYITEKGMRKRKKGKERGKNEDAAVTMGVSVAHTEETFKLIACIKFYHYN